MYVMPIAFEKIVHIAPKNIVREAPEKYIVSEAPKKYIAREAP